MSCETFHIASETSFVPFLENVTGVCHHHDADCWPHILILFWSLEWLKGRHAFFHFYFRVTECIANSVYGPELGAKLALFLALPDFLKPLKTHFCRLQTSALMIYSIDFTYIDFYWNDWILQVWIPIGTTGFCKHGFLLERLDFAFMDFRFTYILLEQLDIPCMDSLLERLDFPCIDSYRNVWISHALIPIGTAVFSMHGFL